MTIQFCILQFNLDFIQLNSEFFTIYASSNTIKYHLPYYLPFLLLRLHLLQFMICHLLPFIMNYQNSNKYILIFIQYLGQLVDVYDFLKSCFTAVAGISCNLKCVCNDFSELEKYALAPAASLISLCCIDAEISQNSEKEAKNFSLCTGLKPNVCNTCQSKILMGLRMRQRTTNDANDLSTDNIS